MLSFPAAEIHSQILSSSSHGLLRSSGKTQILLEGDVAAPRPGGGAPSPLTKTQSHGSTSLQGRLGNPGQCTQKEEDPGLASSQPNTVVHISYVFHYRIGKGVTKYFLQKKKKTILDIIELRIIVVYESLQGEVFSRQFHFFPCPLFFSLFLLRLSFDLMDVTSA